MIRLWAGRSEVQIPVWARDFSLLENVQTCSRASLLFSGYWSSFPAVKQPGHEANYSPPSRTEVKSEWNYISPPSACLHGMDRENLTFTFSLSYQCYRVLTPWSSPS
jgi:hypothetical protein